MANFFKDWTPERVRQHNERIENRRAVSGAEPEPAVCDEPVAEAPRKEINPALVHVRIVSFRRSFCDPDNLCPKYFIDCLRYAGIIRDDRPQDITLEVRQQKVSKEQERTEITITENPT